MFYKKKGYPEVGEFVMCTVKKVLFHSVFVYLDEYEGLEGMLHISEVAPGRIRNIRDYVKEGKKIVCKILRIDNVKRHIDLSLRRVNQAQKRNKVDEYKQEQKAEKLLEGVGSKLKLSVGEMYKRSGYKLIEKFGSLSDSFYAVVEDDVDLIKDVGIDAGIAKELVDVVKDKIKPLKVIVQGIVSITNSSWDGVERIKRVLKMLVDGGVDVSYVGAPKYLVKVTAGDYKEAEAKLDKLLKKAEAESKKLDGEFIFERIKL